MANLLISPHFGIPAFTSSSRGLLVFLIACLLRYKRFHGRRAEDRARAFHRDNDPAHKQLRYNEPWWARLHPSELRCILRSNPAFYWDSLHPSEICYTLLYLATLQPLELCCTHVSYATPQSATLHTSELRCSVQPVLLSFPSYSFLKCRNAGLSGIRSARYQNEKKCRCRNRSVTRIRKPSPGPE
jgi:hypothetical protein